MVSKDKIKNGLSQKSLKEKVVNIENDKKKVETSFDPNTSQQPRSKSEVENIMNIDDIVEERKQSRRVVETDIDILKDQLKKHEQELTEIDQEINDLLKKKSIKEANTVFVERVRELVPCEDQEWFTEVSLVVLDIGNELLKKFMQPEMEFNTVEFRKFAKHYISESLSKESDVVILPGSQSSSFESTSGTQKTAERLKHLLVKRKARDVTDEYLKSDLHKPKDDEVNTNEDEGTSSDSNSDSEGGNNSTDLLDNEGN